MKWPKLKRDRIGMTVETLCDLRNGYVHIPKGTRATVVDWYGGARLKTEACAACGVSIYITRVQEYDIAPLESEADE